LHAVLWVTVTSWLCFYATHFETTE